MKRLIWMLMIPLLNLSQEARAQDDVYMKIQSGGFQPIRISIPTFSLKYPSDIGKNLRQVVIDDLDFSGFFRIVASEHLGSSDGNEDGDSGNPTAEVELDAEVEVRGDRLNVSAQLRELPGNQAIFNKEFDSRLDLMRWLGHKLADEVVFYLVGEQGIASSKIAFATGKRMKREIAMIDYDGDNFRTLTNSDALNISPTWSPKGDYILFTSFISGNPDLVIMRMDSGKLSWIGERKGLHSAPAWSAERNKIALTYSGDGNSDIYTMDPDGRNWMRLTQTPAIDSSPSWSPTGNQIAFTSDRSGNPQIYIMDAEGGNVRRLTFNGNYNDSPAWSPRGDRVAFVSREEGRFQIYTISVSGENLQRVTDGEGSNENPSWAPNGLKLAFASDRAGLWSIYVINWDGTHLRRVTASGENVTPEWSPLMPLE